MGLEYWRVENNNKAVSELVDYLLLKYKCTDIIKNTKNVILPESVSYYDGILWVKYEYIYLVLDFHSLGVTVISDGRHLICNCICKKEKLRISWTPSLESDKTMKVHFLTPKELRRIKLDKINQTMNLLAAEQRGIS